MKKITLVTFLFLFAISWNSVAQITSYPYQEDFESGDGGWVANNTTNGTWALGTPIGTIINSADSGSNAWVTNLSGTYNSSEDSWVTSPVFDFSGLTSPSIEFSIWYDIEFSWDGAVLQSSIDSGASWQNVGAFGDPNNWYTDNTINGNPGGQQEGWSGTGTAGTGGWVIARHALTGLGGQSNVLLRVAFGSDTSVTDDGMAFDSINIFEVECPDPINLALSNITDSSADVSWQDGASGGNWEIVIQPAGTGVPAGSGIPTTTNNPYLFTMLTPSTAYEVYVRANCMSDGFSSWTGPLSFTTLNTPPPPPDGVTCNSGASSFIFTEDFETDPASGWTGTSFTGNNGDWDITAGDANSGGTGPLTSFSGGLHLEYEASGNSTNIASAISPAIDLSTAVDGAEMSFYMHAFGSDMGTLNVGVGTSVTGPFTTLFTWVGDYQTSDGEAWIPIGINLDAYLGQVIYVEFSYGGAGTGWEGDMSIDLFRVESCGSFCIAPSQLTVSNISGTTADVSWTPNSGETDWEYVLQPAGTGEPTGTGIATNTTTVNFTDLDFSTDYEVYVRADCGSDYSTWSGPLSFSTTIQLNYQVDCTAGPITQDYCYGNDIDDDPSLETFTFTSSDGTPLNLSFNSGFVEDCCDELVVLDSDGTELLNDSVGDVSGLTFQSTGDTISFYVNSDFSISCESGSYPEGINYTVACATCINPVANYIVVDDCDNGDQFLIDVDITSFGDAVSLTISDNTGTTTPVQVFAEGVTQMGPYPFLTDIIITIENDDDANCIINSGIINQLACPPDNDNPCNATIAVVNDDESCDQINSGTLVAASDSGVPTGSCTGNPDDDVWFEFVALSEVQLLSLINIQGSTTNLDHGLYEGTCDNLVELYCSNDDASVTPQLTIGNTYFVRVFSGGSNEETSTFDLCIKEAPDNIICENASNFCSDGGALYGTNIIGIPDPTDVACLGSIPNPSWNVIQIGESGPIEIQIEQNTEFDADGNPIGTGLDVDFVLWGPFDNETDYCALDLLSDCPSCPNNTSNPDFYPFGNIVDCSYDPADVENVTIENAIAGEIYLLLVTNFSNQPGVIQIQQTNVGDTDSGSITAEIEVDLGQDQDLCGFPDYTIMADSPFADTYEWYQNGIYMPDETGSSITVTESDTYTVIVYNEQCDVYAQDEIVINFYQDANAFPVDDLVTCDDVSGDEIEDFDLELQTPGLLGDQNPSDFVVTYHLSFSDAQMATGALSSPYNNVSNPQTIYVRIEDVDAVGSGSGCFVTSSFDLIISGQIPTATSVDLEACDDSSNDGIEEFDLDSHSVNILDGQSDSEYMVSYYQSEADAEAGTGALTSPYTNMSNPETIWVRVESIEALDCYSTTSFNLIVNQMPLATSVNFENCDIMNDGQEAFDLDTHSENILDGQSASDFNVSYYLSEADAMTATGALTSPYTNVSSPETIWVRVENAMATECFVTTSFDLILNQMPLATSVDISTCDSLNDGEEEFDLDSHSVNILDGQSDTDFSVSYYQSEADANAGTGALTSPYTNISNPETIWARVDNVSATDCYVTTSFDLILNQEPDVVFSLDYDYEVCPNATIPVEIAAELQNFAESEVSVKWYLDNVEITGQNSLILPTVLLAGEYTIEVTNTTDNLSCTVTETIEVIELESCVIPQGISPNGDGDNDVFDLSSYDVHRLEIYNRNGKLVYSKDNYSNEWVGQTDQGERLPVGTYFYVMSYQDNKKRTAWIYLNY